MHRVRMSETRALILPLAEAGGRLLTNLEFCKAHGRSRTERHKAAGLKVYEDRASA